MKLPAFQFYPGDWRKDPAVQMLSYHHRGIWLELLCFMFESPIRGKLLLKQNPSKNKLLLPTMLQLSRLLGLSETDTKLALDVILEAGAASICTETGAFMCRRMVEDERLREIRARAGSKGGKATFAQAKRQQNTEDEDEVQKRKSTREGTKGLVDSEWLARLVNDETYKGIDVKREFGKMTNWCREHRVEPTRRRFINWLNRADRRIDGTGKNGAIESGRGLGTANEGKSSQYAGVGKIKPISNP